MFPMASTDTQNGPLKRIYNVDEACENNILTKLSDFNGKFYLFSVSSTQAFHSTCTANF